MLNKIISFSLKNRWFMMLFTLVICILGFYNIQRLPIDAVPDITNVQVQINTQAEGFSPYEVEQRITFPIEIAMSGMPGLDYTRSLSRYGLSQVTVVFKDGTDIYLARQLINERLQEVKSKLPNSVVPMMGPITTGLGEIYMYTVNNAAYLKPKDRYSPAELRTIQDWIIKPQLKRVEGVADINTVGGYVKQFHVTPDPMKLVRYKLSLNDVLNALERNNANVGAGYVERNGEQYLIRVPGQVTNLDEILHIVVATYKGTPIQLSQVAEVTLGKELRTGAATEDGQEVVLGTVFMLTGENSRLVSKRVDEKLKLINKTLPPGVIATTIYDRTELVNATIHTVEKNLFEGAILVCVVLFIFLGNIRAALITAMVIPLSLLLTFTGMVTEKISANLMSLGALDFGLIVDGAVIIVENSIKHLVEKQQVLKRVLTQDERFNVILVATTEVIRPSIFGVFIITVVYIPILTLTHVEGKMFIPMAQTVIMALISSVVFALTFVPAAIGIFLNRQINEHEWGFLTQLRNLYRHSLQQCLAHPKQTVYAALVLVILSIGLASRLGGEFIPSLDEGDIAMHAIRIPGTSLTQSIAMQHQLERAVKKIPEVDKVVSKLGTADIANDPMPPSVADTYIMIKPRSEWSNPKKSKQDLVLEIEKVVKAVPGNNYEFTQPIQMRFNELISGVRSDVAIKVFGDDLKVLLSIAEQIQALVQKIPGAADIKVEQVSGLPLTTIEVNRQALSRYGLQLSEVQDALMIAMGGKKGGDIFDGDKRFDIIVRLPENLRTSPQVLRDIFVPLPASANGEKSFIPLTEVAKAVTAESPNQISREEGKRRVVVTANVRGTDLTHFVQQVQIDIERNIKTPPGYWITFGGQFEQLQSAMTRLEIAVPVTLIIIFFMLVMTLGRMSDALLVFTGIPLALTGGIISLWLRDIPFSVSAGVGFIALSGIAVLNGLVMITFINRLQTQSHDSLEKSVFEGSIARLRPVLMTGLVASLGFVPMALATGTGSEVQRPLATVVIGGILSATFLTLFVLPCLYVLFHKNKVTKA